VFHGWQETVHLLSNPVNAARLLRSIRSAGTGGTQERDLVVPAIPE
jgi:antitoxin YefM